MSYSAQAGIVKYHRLDGWSNGHYFSQFWILETQDQGASMVRSGEDSLSGLWFSFCLFCLGIIKHLGSEVNIFTAKWNILAIISSSIFFYSTLLNCISPFETTTTHMLDHSMLFQKILMCCLFFSVLHFRQFLLLCVQVHWSVLCSI